jgi:DNA-binding Xre family transcriptional regulator
MSDLPNSIYDIYSMLIIAIVQAQVVVYSPGMAGRLKIREVARQRGIGQSKLSRLADIDVRVLHRYFSESYINITIISLEKLARALYAGICDLIESEPPIEKIEQNEGKEGDREKGNG